MEKFKFNKETKQPFYFDYDTKDLKCIICESIYTTYNDPFIYVIDTNSDIEITYELCLNCVKSLKQCLKCNKNFDEPWECIYYNISDKTYYCKKCS
jgi:hypothetical protein